MQLTRSRLGGGKRSVYDWAVPVFKNTLQYVSKVEVKNAERDTGILREAQPI